MAAGFVYWIAEDKLQRLSEAFQLFKNHNGWKGEIACVFILGNVLGEVTAMEFHTSTSRFE